MGSQRVRHHWTTFFFCITYFIHITKIVTRERVTWITQAHFGIIIIADKWNPIPLVPLQCVINQSPFPHPCGLSDISLKIQEKLEELVEGSCNFCCSLLWASFPFRRGGCWWRSPKPAPRADDGQPVLVVCRCFGWRRDGAISDSQSPSLTPAQPAFQFTLSPLWSRKDCLRPVYLPNKLALVWPGKC